MKSCRYFISSNFFIQNVKFLDILQILHYAIYLITLKVLILLVLKNFNQKL